MLWGEYFLEGFKNQNSTFVWVLMAFHIFFVKNINKSFFLLFWNHLPILKNLPVTLFSFLITVCESKIFSKSCLWSWNFFPKAGQMHTKKKIDQWEGRKAGREIWSGFRNNLENFEVFSKNQAETLYNIFFTKAG